MPDGRIDIRRLGKHLVHHIDGLWGLTSAIKFAGGQSNPTYLLKAGAGQYVLRRKPQGKLLGSAHAIDREFRLLKALETTEVPVARPLHYCEDRSIIGSEFYVMEYVDGRIFWDQTLPDQTRQGRHAIFDAMNRCLASIHAVELKDAGLGDFGRSENYYPRQLSRWVGQYRDSQTEFHADLEHLIGWLKENMINESGAASLIHGDFRMDNFIWHPEKPEVMAVIDWELSTLGHPLSDLAYQCMVWRLLPGETTRGLAGINRQIFGIPSEEQYIEAYCKRMGVEGLEDWEFHLAFAFFRLAAILQGVTKRAKQGNATSEHALEYGKMVPELAKQGLEVALGGHRTARPGVQEMSAFGKCLLAS